MIALPLPFMGTFVTDLIPIVGAATGKVHTILNGAGGYAYGSLLRISGDVGPFQEEMIDSCPS